MQTFKISDKELWNNINSNFGNKGGLYKLICYESGKPKSINRFLSSDNNGVLYIGKATSYLDRVITLKKSLDYNNYIDTNHECGARYKTHPTIKDLFHFEELHIELTPSDNPSELERKELKEYYFSFGELPPLNRQG